MTKVFVEENKFYFQSFLSLSQNCSQLWHSSIVWKKRNWNVHRQNHNKHSAIDKQSHVAPVSFCNQFRFLCVCVCVLLCLWQKASEHFFQESSNRNKLSGRSVGIQNTCFCSENQWTISFHRTKKNSERYKCLKGCLSIAEALLSFQILKKTCWSFSSAK